MKRVLRWWPSLIPFTILFYLIHWYYQWEHWLSHATGSYDTPAGTAAGTPHHYNFFSGFGSDLGYTSIVASVIGAALLQWRMHTCHYKWWCWRHPHHNLEGTPYKLCTRHHPDDVPTVAEAVAAHKANGGTS